MKDVEIQLILACSRIVLSPALILRIRESASQVSNWPDVLRTAGLHGVIPLLYTHLKKTCPDLITDEVMNQLRGMYVSNSKKNLSVSAALLNTLNIFSANGILALPFKGPVLAERVYGSVSLRQFSDLDILIQKQDAVMASNLLMENGYEAEVKLSGKKGEKYLEFENSISFFHHKGGPSIDLHWEMTGRYLLKPLDIQTVKRKLKYSDFLSQKILSMPDDILLIYLCVHGISHCWERLEWLCCFVEMVRRKSEKDLCNIIELAGEMGCKRMLYLGFYLGKDLVEAPLPGKVLENIVSDSGVVEYGKKIKQNFFLRKTGPIDEAGWRFSPLHIGIRDTFPDRIKYAIYLFTMPTIKEWVKCPLPAWLTPLYVVIRPIRLTITFLSGKIRSITKRKQLMASTKENSPAGKQ